MSLVCINVTNIFFCQVVFFPAVFSAGRQTCLVAWMSFMPLDRFAARLKKRLEKKLHDWKKIVLHLFKLETCTYISLAAMYGLTAIDKILVAGWKHASFLCYSMGVRRFLRILGPKLELPRSSAYSPYLRCLCAAHTPQTSVSKTTSSSINKFFQQRYAYAAKIGDMQQCWSLLFVLCRWLCLCRIVTSMWEVARAGDNMQIHGIDSRLPTSIIIRAD